MAIDVTKIKELREETGASIADIRMALEQTKNDIAKAKEWLKTRGLEKAGKKKGRETNQGLIEGYVHGNGRVGVLVEVLCETDFVARTDDFKNLCHEIAMQVAAMNPKNTEELLSQPYIRDNSQTVDQLIKGIIGKLGENIIVNRFERIAIGID